MADLLITYGTRYGSTKEVAESIAQTLRDTGLSIDLKPASEVQSLAGYRAVVVGAPYFIGKLQKDVPAFLERHRAELEKMPVALFTLGPVRAEDDMADARKQLDATLEKMGWLKPAAAEMFVGAFDPAKLRGLDKLVTKPKASPLYGVPARDDRDWEAIRAWAASLPGALGLA